MGNSKSMNPVGSTILVVHVKRANFLDPLDDIMQGIRAGTSA